MLLLAKDCCTLLPINDDLLLSAKLERQLRELKAQRATVTRHEVLGAIILEHAILTEYAEAEYPNAVAPVLMPAVTLQ